MGSSSSDRPPGAYRTHAIVDETFQPAMETESDGSHRQEQPGNDRAVVECQGTKSVSAGARSVRSGAHQQFLRIYVRLLVVPARQTCGSAPRLSNSQPAKP